MATRIVVRLERRLVGNAVVTHRARTAHTQKVCQSNQSEKSPSCRCIFPVEYEYKWGNQPKSICSFVFHMDLGYGSVTCL